MEVDGPRRNELKLQGMISQVRTTLLLTRLVESIVEWLKPSVLERPDTLTNSLVQDIDTMSATVSTRNSSGLTVKAHTKSTEIAE